MGIASRHRLLLVLQRSVCRFKGASLHEFQVHVAVAGIGRKALGGTKILLDRGAAADGESQYFSFSLTFSWRQPVLQNTGTLRGFATS